MATKKELEAKIDELNQIIEDLRAQLDACQQRVGNEALATLLPSAPMFPINYDDKVLAIEHGFKPAYLAFLESLRALV